MMMKSVYLRNRAGSTIPLLLAAAVAVSLVAGGVWYFFLRPDGTIDEQAMTATVIEDSFVATVLDQGEVESSENVEFRCEVKGGTTIISIIPEGEMVRGPKVTLNYERDPLFLSPISPIYAAAFHTIVSDRWPWKGDLLVKLDSSALETSRTQQLISVNNAESLVTQAESTLQAAEVAREEFLLGIFKQDEQLILNEIFEAEENMRKAEQYLAYSERLAARQFVTQLQLEADRFAVRRAENALDLANRKLDVLRNQTKKRMLIEFDANIRTAGVKWENEKESLQVETDKLVEIDKQIANCTIRVPQDVEGQVVHANEFSRRGGSEWVAEAGATVRERQPIIRLPNPELMQVKATVNETRVTQVRAGMPVIINLDALEDGKHLRGEVIKVNQYAEPTGFSSGGIKEYGVLIRIFAPPAEIRPGMNAAVKIITDQRKSVLQIPIQAVYEYRGHQFCLQRDGSDWKTREIVISATNDTMAVVEKGLRKGEEVVLSPRRFEKYMELPDLPDPTKESARDQDADPTGSSSDAALSPRPAGTNSPSDSQGRQDDNPPRGGDPSQFFARLDLNGDGKIDSDEMGDVPERMRESLSAADSDGDGAISRAEFETALQQLRGSGGPPGDARP